MTSLSTWPTPSPARIPLTRNACDDSKGDGKLPAPKFANWVTVKTVNAKDFDMAYTFLEKHVAKGTWKSDIYTRGGEVHYKKEKCTWRRRMTKDGKNFARVIEYKGGYVLQKGVLALGKEEEAVSYTHLTLPTICSV